MPTSRLPRLTAMVLLLMLGLGGPVSAARAATNPVTQDDLCHAWNQVGTADPEIELSSGLTVRADQLQRLGASCTAPDAGVALIGASIVESTGGPSSGGSATSQLLAAVTHATGTNPDLKEGDELFKGAYLKNFNAVLKFGYFEISGAVEVRWSGGNTSRFLFKGKLYGVNRFVMNLYSPAGGTYLPNVGGTPVEYAGVLELDAAGYRLTLEGSAPSIVIGDGAQQVSVTDASISLGLTTGDSPRITAKVAGTVGIGSTVRAGGSIDLDFDDTGLKSLSGSGSLALQLPARGSSPAGEVAGSATFSYTRDPLVRSVTFAGNVRLGDTVVAGATGTLDDQSMAFAGNVTLTNPQLTASGAVDGIVYYGDDLSGRTITNRAGQQVQATKGDTLLKSASGSVTAKGLSLSGSLQIGDVGGEIWASAGGSVDLSFTTQGQPDTQIKGSADITWIQGGATTASFSGSVKSGTTEVLSASGTIDGQKLVFTGQVTSPTVSGKASGAVYYGTDLAGETIKNRAGQLVPVTRGDFSLTVADGRVQLKQLLATANFTVSKVGLETWVKTDAQIKVASTWLAFSGELDSSGSFNLKGSGQVNFDGYVIAFQGTAVSKDGKLVLSGGGSFKTGLFTVALSGTIEKPDMNTSAYILTGKVDFKFGKYSVAGGQVRLTFGEGMTTTFGLKACIFFFCQNGTYKLYFAPTGAVNRAELNAPLTSVPMFLGIGSAVLGSNVKITTKITGIL